MDGQKRFLEDKGGAIEKTLMDEAIRKGVIEDVILKRMKKDREALLKIKEEHHGICG
jgi:hypothetical protein